MIRGQRHAYVAGGAAALTAFLGAAPTANPYRGDHKVHAYWNWGFDTATRAFGTDRHT